VQTTKHIFLTGFMGCGKSTAGAKLAPILKTRFFDLDVYLEKKENKSIPEIFEEQGEQAFRELEKKYLLELLQFKEQHVIALGGGTVCFGKNLELVKNNGTLIYIELPVAVLADRIQQSKTSRPLLKNLSSEELIKNIEAILSERKKYYEQAHITVNGLNLTAQHLQQKLLAYHSENNPE